MPPLLCAPPSILDQSFPRSGNELRRAAVALGELVEAIAANQARLLLTPLLREIVLGFDFESRADYPILIEIHKLLTQWFLQTHEGLVQVDLSSLHGHRPHPVPIGCSADNLIIFWSDEMGRLLMAHDTTNPTGPFYIGVACVHAFAGEQLGNYSSDDRALPLVGRNDLAARLADSDEWVVDREAQKVPITFDLAKKNCIVLGATGVDRPSRGSHYKVRFPGARSWTLDANHDPIPERHLRELCVITGLPFDVVWCSLVRGEPPRKRSRIHEWLA